MSSSNNSRSKSSRGARISVRPVWRRKVDICHNLKNDVIQNQPHPNDPCNYPSQFHPSSSQLPHQNHHNIHQTHHPNMNHMLHMQTSIPNYNPTPNAHLLVIQMQPSKHHPLMEPPLHPYHLHHQSTTTYLNYHLKPLRMHLLESPSHYHPSHILMNTSHHHPSIHHLSIPSHGAYLKPMETLAYVASTTAPSHLA